MDRNQSPGLAGPALHHLGTLRHQTDPCRNGDEAAPRILPAGPILWVVSGVRGGANGICLTSRIKNFQMFPQFPPLPTWPHRLSGGRPSGGAGAVAAETAGCAGMSAETPREGLSDSWKTRAIVQAAGAWGRAKLHLGESGVRGRRARGGWGVSHWPAHPCD